MDLDQAGPAGGRRAAGAEGRPEGRANKAEQNGHHRGGEPAVGERRPTPSRSPPDAPAADAPDASTLTAAAAPAAGNQKRSRNRKKRRREIRPPERKCQSCVDFLKDKKTVEIPCKHCGTPIYWPPESQLQTHLGAWSEPSMCGACKRDATEAARAVEREALRAAATANQPHPPAAEAPTEAPGPDAPAAEAPPAPASADAGSVSQA